MIPVSRFLGRKASDLLSEEPFNGWEFLRSVEDELDPPIVEYVFCNRGVELQCSENEEVQVIFLFADQLDDVDGALLGRSALCFGQKRQRLTEAFGAPEASGDAWSDPVLGDYGAWDRFSLDTCVVHVEYSRAAA
ncbi:MAG: hypothetical protein AAF550_12610, partial [Myxococcota bacterium]